MPKDRLDEYMRLKEIIREKERLKLAEKKARKPTAAQPVSKAVVPKPTMAVVPASPTKPAPGQLKPASPQPKLAAARPTPAATLPKPAAAAVQSKPAAAPPKPAVAPASAPPKQAASQPKQAAVQPKPAAAPPKQASTPPKQASTPPKQAAAQPKQASARPNPTTAVIQPKKGAAQSKPAAVQPKPAAVQPEQAAVQPKEAAAKPTPAAVQPKPVAVPPESATVQPASAPASAQPKPATTPPKPAAQPTPPVLTAQTKPAAGPEPIPAQSKAKAAQTKRASHEVGSETQQSSGPTASTSGSAKSAPVSAKSDSAAGPAESAPTSGKSVSHSAKSALPSAEAGPAGAETDHSSTKSGPVPARPSEVPVSIDPSVPEGDSAVVEKPSQPAGDIQSLFTPARSGAPPARPAVPCPPLVRPAVFTHPGSPRSPRPPRPLVRPAVFTPRQVAVPVGSSAAGAETAVPSPAGGGGRHPDGEVAVASAAASSPSRSVLGAGTASVPLSGSVSPAQSGVTVLEPVENPELLAVGTVAPATAGGAPLSELSSNSQTAREDAAADSTDPSVGSQVMGTDEGQQPEPADQRTEPAGQRPRPAAASDGVGDLSAAEGRDESQTSGDISPQPETANQVPEPKIPSGLFKFVTNTTLLSTPETREPVISPVSSININHRRDLYFRKVLSGLVTPSGARRLFGAGAPAHESVSPHGGSTISTGEGSIITGEAATPPKNGSSGDGTTVIEPSSSASGCASVPLAPQGTLLSALPSLASEAARDAELRTQFGVSPCSVRLERLSPDDVETAVSRSVVSDSTPAESRALTTPAAGPGPERRDTPVTETGEVLAQTDSQDPDVSEELSAPVAVSGEELSAPVAVSGEEVSAPVAVSGEELSAPVAVSGEELSAPVAVSGEELSAPVAVSGEEVSAPVAVSGEELSAPAAAVGQDSAMPETAVRMIPEVRLDPALPEVTMVNHWATPETAADGVCGTEEVADIWEEVEEEVHEEFEEAEEDGHSPVVMLPSDLSRLPSLSITLSVNTPAAGQQAACSIQYEEDTHEDAQEDKRDTEEDGYEDTQEDTQEDAQEEEEHLPHEEPSPALSDAELDRMKRLLMVQQLKASEKKLRDVR